MRINDVDDWVQSVGLIVDRFYPMAAAKATGLPLVAVFRQLVGLSHIGWLELAYEVRCNACNVSIAIEKVVDPTTLYENDYSCHLCGDEVEITAENVFPIFLVREEWSSGLKKAPAANGRITSPIGGEPASLGHLNLDTGIRWSDALLPGEHIETLREIARISPEIKKLVDVLEGKFPGNSGERRSKLATIKEIGETADVWADVFMKAGVAAAPYILASWPAVQASILRALSAIGVI